MTHGTRVEPPWRGLGRQVLMVEKDSDDESNQRPLYKSRPFEESIVERITLEHARCLGSAAYFINTHCWIEDKTSRRWIPFELWMRQNEMIMDIPEARQVIILKARQLGLTWLMVCYALWMMIFKPGSGILLFSRRDDEASELVDRIRGVHARLPAFLQATKTTDNAHEIAFGYIDSWARSFPTTKHSGRMYTATLAIVDEADFIQWLKRLLNAVKPTIDAGGQLILLSTADKEKPNSEFKRIWREAVKENNNYEPKFLPWNARPERNEEWYEHQKADYEEDDLYQEYPANPEQALAARKASKRFSPNWITQCRGNRDSIDGASIAPGFRFFLPPRKGRRFLLAADPAEGNPGSDPSAASLFDLDDWEQVGVLEGKFEPDIFANYLILIARHYNGAKILWERNNHGHAVEVAIRYQEYDNIYCSPFDKKPGWLSNRKNKVLAVDLTAQNLRSGTLILNDEATINELAIFEAATLTAPEGDHDDLAMTVILGVAGIEWPSYQEKTGEGVSEMVRAHDPLENLVF